MNSIYDQFMKPLENKGIRIRREKLIPQANGNVLEIGSGTGVNLKFYDFGKVTSLRVTDMEINKILINKVNVHQERESINLEQIDVQNLPYDNDLFDSVVCIRAART